MESRVSTTWFLPGTRVGEQDKRGGRRTPGRESARLKNDGEGEEEGFWNRTPLVLPPVLLLFATDVNASAVVAAISAAAVSAAAVSAAAASADAGWVRCLLGMYCFVFGFYSCLCMRVV